MGLVFVFLNLSSPPQCYCITFVLYINFVYYSILFVFVYILHLSHYYITMSPCGINLSNLTFIYYNSLFNN